MRAADSPLAFKAYYLGMKLTAPWSARLSGWFAHKIWFTPWTVKPGERGLRKQAEWLSRSTPVRFSTTHGTIVGFEAGSGPAVLLVHGWGERGADLGGFIEPLVGAGYRVVGVDLPGHGASVDTEPNLYVVSETIRDVAQQLGGIAAVIAHSMGGHSTMVALRDGLEVDAVVLLSPSSRLANALTRFTEMLSLPPRAATALKQKLERRFGAQLWDEVEGTALVENVRAPALIVHDPDDPQVPVQDSERLVAAWEEARLVTTEGLGHGRIMRDERVIADTVRFLIEQVAPPQRQLEDASS